MLVTPLQLAGAYATLATGLRPPTPHVLADRLPRPAAAGRRPPAAGSTAAALHAGDGRGCTGLSAPGRARRRRRSPGSRSTGCRSPARPARPRCDGKADTSLFAAVAPADDPRYVVVAVIEEAGFGSTVAAPIVRRVLEVLTGVSPPAPASRCRRDRPQPLRTIVGRRER